MEENQSKPASPVPDPPIRTLKVELLSNNSTGFVPCIPNAREPTPFETEFFKGIAMIIIRTKPVDSHFNNFFEGRKRLFEVQVQGKFKREPAGEIFVGAEATQKPELGILTKSISRIVLQFISTLVSDLHYSFGETPDSPHYEAPHVSSPIFITFDKILISPPGETPPPLGVPFVEDIEYRKKRLKYRFIKDAQIDLNTTYSFSVNTSNLDLLTWTVVGIPMVKPMDLRTYSSNGSISLIGYEIPRTAQTKFPTTHPKKLLNYVFNMRLTPVNPEELPIMDLPLITSEDEEEEKEAEVEGEGEGEGEVEGGEEEAEGEGDVEADVEVEEGEMEDGEEFSGEENEEVLEGEGGERGARRRLSSLFRRRRKKKSDGERVTMSSWLKKKFTRSKNAGRLLSADEEGEEGGLGQWDRERREMNQVDYDHEAFTDLSFVPACIECNEHRVLGRRRYYFLFLLPPALPSPSATLSPPSHEGLKFRIRSYSDISARCKLLLSSADLPPNCRALYLSSKHKFNTNEKRRRVLVEHMKNLTNTPSTTNPTLHAENLKKLSNFLFPINDHDIHFLGGNVEIEEDYVHQIWKGHIALALSRRHYTEQYMTITKDILTLQKHKDSKLHTLTLPLCNLLFVRILPPVFCPIACMGCLELHTLTRVYTILVRSDMQLNGWLQVFVTLGISENKNKLRNTSNLSNNADEEVYIAKCVSYRSEKRRVYNYRRIYFKDYNTSVYQSPGQSDRAAVVTSIPPNELIENLLVLAFELVQQTVNSSVTVKKETMEAAWIKFWEGIALLQVINLIGLSETEKLSFYLNLYHIMVLHGCLIFGPPPAWNHWHAFFNQISYVVAFELVSIAELEYCILRAGMAKSSLFTAVAMSAPPQTIFPTLALQRKDFRLHFAINCGSLSFLSQVPIYTPEHIDEQLDEVTRRTLEHSLEIDLNKKTVVIPKLPLSDYSSSNAPDTPFTTNPANNSNSTNNNKSTSSSLPAVDCLRVLAPYLVRSQKQALVALLADPLHLTVRYRNLNFKCRIFKKLEMPSISHTNKIRSSSVTDSQILKDTAI